MKNFFLLSIILLSQTLFLFAENNAINQSQAIPWVREQNLQFNMGILAKVYKDGSLFQPTGVWLGVFKDNKCWGLAQLGNSPVGPLHNLTMGCNTSTATGYTYLVYDPTTSLTWNVTQTVNFNNGVPVGAINAPISLNISTLVYNSTLSTDYFRSLASGNWGDAATWQSSYNNTNWISATSAPTSSAISINILNGHTVNITGNSTTPSLTVNSGAVLNVNAGKQLTVQTALNNSGILNLLSNATGTATILTPTSISGSGTANVQQYLSTERNWYISSPVSNANAPTGFTYYKYNEAASSFSFPAFNVGDQFESGTGYIALPTTSPATITFTTQAGGALNSGNKTIPLTFQGATKKGFNLIGNPYPANLNWTAAFVDAVNAPVGGTAPKTLIEPTIWYRTNTGGTSNSTGTWSFLTLNASTGQSVPAGVSRIIPPMQAFWVRAKADGNLILDNTKLSLTHATSNPLKAPAVKNNQYQNLRLEVSNGTNTDETLIYFDANASNGYDRYDSPKMSNNNAAIPEIYTIAGTEQLVINGLKSISENTEMPLGFTTGQSNTFSLKATEFNNFEAGLKVYIKDNLLNVEQELTSSTEYSFTTNPTTTNSRFTLIFKSNSTTTDINETVFSKQNVLVYNENNQIVVNCPGDLINKSFVVVYNTYGQMLLFKTITSPVSVLNIQLSSGVYLVKISNSGKIVTKKIIIDSDK